MTKSSSIPAGEGVGGPSQRLTPRAFLEVKRLHDPRMHPDGQRIAFTVHEADFEESRWVSHIWITEFLPAVPVEPPSLRDAEAADSVAEVEEHVEDAEALTSDDLTRQLTFSVEGETDPEWSPDGRYLAFLSIRPDTSANIVDEDDDMPPIAQIWALPMDGGEARRITNTKEPILDFAWTPDGQSLIYLTLMPRPQPLETVYKDRERRKIDPMVENDDPRRRQFWSVNVEERKPQLMFVGDYGVESFALSPQGDRIAYLTNYTGEDNDYHIADLYVRHLETGASVKVIKRSGGKYRLRWSPSGSRIAFLSWHDPLLSYSRESIYVAEMPSGEALSVLPPRADNLPAAYSLANGASLHQLIRSSRQAVEAEGLTEAQPISELDFDITSFEWLDDNQGVLALTASGTVTELYNLGNGDDPHNPAGRRESLSDVHLMGARADRRELAIHPESGRSVWIQESGSSPPEVVLRDADGQEHTLTGLNAQFAETYVMPRQEVVTWRSPDGQNVEGVLTYPLDCRPGRPDPLIVQVHGGPKGRATDSLLDYSMPAVWASEGYLVLRPNYRGSEGYGNAFAVANRRDLGGCDYADVISGVDWCIEQGLADGERLGILGGSYGGYMVNWAVGHTNRFKGAISMFGIFHLQTDYSNSRLSRWEHDYVGAYYWEDPEIYRKLSPASYLEDIQTPTLILHGDEDDNTSISNSREMYRALLQRGVPTQFVHYPREGHGIQEPNHRLDELRRCLAWMDSNVRDAGRNRSIYRVGDRVPHANGRLELCVTTAEVIRTLGQSSEENAKDRAAPVLLEIVITVNDNAQRELTEPLILHLSEIRIEDTRLDLVNRVQLPAGVPLEVPGGKVLVEGENLRVVQHPDSDTGELAFAIGVVYRVPKSGSGRLYVCDFPGVAVHWSAADEEEGASEDTGHPTPGPPTP